MSKIEWCDRSDWNPIRGCTRVSEGCRHCYAEQIAGRFSDEGAPFDGFATRVGREGRWTGKVELIEDRLTLPLKWRKPAVVFVNSGADLFHESLPDAAIDRVFAVMALAPHLTFVCLTKRAKRMRQWADTPERVDRVADEAFEIANAAACANLFKARRAAMAAGVERAPVSLKWPLRNVVLGVSVEDQPRADERIPDLLATPAAKRIVSIEPMLGPISARWAKWVDAQATFDRQGSINHLEGLRGLDGVILGGESGPHARPMHPDWARSVRDQCAAAGVPFFFKQWGEFREFDTGPPPHEEIDNDSESADAIYAAAINPSFVTPDGRRFARIGLPLNTPARLIERVGKSRAGRLLDGREHNDLPWSVAK